ncbi:MAG: hypothetical protein ACFCGT_25635 [Sandaracinaceae bacterium]
MLWFLVGALLVVIVMVLWQRSGLGTKGGRRRAVRASAASLRRRLRRMVHGASTAERLIDAQKRKQPGLSEIEAIRRAIRSVKKDRR